MPRSELPISDLVATIAGPRHPLAELQLLAPLPMAVHYSYTRGLPYARCGDGEEPEARITRIHAAADGRFGAHLMTLTVLKGADMTRLFSDAALAHIEDLLCHARSAR